MMTLIFIRSLQQVKHKYLKPTYLANRSSWILILQVAICLFISSCTQNLPKATPAEITILENAMTGKGSEYSQPRLVLGELTVQIDSIGLLAGESLANDNAQREIPTQEPPSIHIWSADILPYKTQLLVEDGTYNPTPDTSYRDAEFGNHILYWNLSQELNTETSISITRKFKYITYDYRPHVDPVAERQNWSDIPDDIITKYTRSEPFLEQDDALVDTVFRLLENVSDPVQQARTIYNWVQQKMTYVYPPEGRGVRFAYETFSGDCGQFTALFTTMARIAGIPTRQQSGLNFYPGNTGYHVWSEVYFPVKGWVPVDATRKDGFLHLDNGRLISSIGLNIPLNDIPEWARFSNSELEAGRTDFMQMFTLASSGVTAKFGAQRIVHRSVMLQN